MAKIRNTARGPRGLRNKSGDVVMLSPGEEVDSDDFEKSEIDDFKAMLKPPAPPEEDNGDPPVPDEPPVNEGGAADATASEDTAERSPRRRG